MTEDYTQPFNDNKPTEPTHQKILTASDATTVGPPNLVDNREVAHEALFKGELPYEPQPDEEDIGLSGLWRAHTHKKGAKGETVNSHFDEIPKIVELILSDHERLSRTPEGSNGAAIFSFLSPEAQAIVSEITTGAIKNWELALYRNEQPFLLTNTNENIDYIDSERLAHLVGMQSTVIETAAAILEVLPEFVNNPMKPTKTEKEDLSKLISNWGPNFVREWFNGTIIEKHFRQSGLEDTEIKEWLNTFSPGLRRHFAVGNINNPMEALDRVKANLDNLNDRAIAERLGWSEEDARDIITPGMRRRFAVGNISDPFAGLIDYINGKIKYSNGYYSGK